MDNTITEVVHVDNPAAWHPDPTGAHEYRWWDGSRWTEHVADGGQASVDPLAGGPGSDRSEEAASGTSPEGEAMDGSAAGSTAAAATEGEPSSGASPWQQPEAAGPGTTAPQPERTWQTGAPAAGGGYPQQGAAPGYDPYPGGQQPASWSQPAAQATSTGTNGIAIAALVIGILSLLIAWVPFLGLLGGVGGVLALILGFVGRSKAKDPSTGGNGAAITGIVTGILALVLSIVVTVGVFALGGTFFSSFTDCIEAGGSEAECQEELERDLLRRFG